MTQTPTRQQIQQGWDSVAVGFDTHTTPRSMEWGRNSLRHIDVGPGRSFLDVGAGTGGLCIPAAMTGADVTAVDISHTMIELLDKRADSVGLDIDTRAMDATNLEFIDNRFDVVASMNGVSTIPDAVAGLAEMTRVTRPRGQVLVVAFGAMDKAEWLVVFLGALAEVIPGFNGPGGEGPPLPFQFSDRTVLRSRLEGAGLSEVRVIAQRELIHFATGQAFLDMMKSSNPIGAQMVSQLDDEQKDLVIAALDQRLAQMGGELSTELNVGVGGKR